MSYSELIEHTLNKLNREYKRSDTYYICQSLFTKDNNPSAVWYTNDGTMELFNAPYNNKYRLTLKEVMEAVGLKEDYLMWVCKKHNISYIKLNKFKEMSLDFIKDDTEYKKLKKLIYPLCSEEFISYDYIIYSKPINKIVFEKPKAKKTESSIVETSISYEEVKQIEEYAKSRKIQFDKNIYPVKLLISGLFCKLAICFEYTNGFKKYRMLFGKFRYMSSGSYNDLFEVKNNNLKQAIYVEGEIEALSIKEYVDDYDIYAIHNCRSVPKTDISKRYDKIIVLVDKDKFEENKFKIFEDLVLTTKENCSIMVKYKLDDVEEDFNSLLIKNKLNQEVVNECISK